MEEFKKGDILRGNRKQERAWHPIVYISGPKEAPLAVVLTHSKSFVCNIPLNLKYRGKKSYFVAHLIEKMSEWGPYTKSDDLKLSKDDLELILMNIRNQRFVTWQQYLDDTKNNCIEHGNRCHGETCSPTQII